MRLLKIIPLVLLLVFAPLFAGAQEDMRKARPNDDFLIIGHMGAPLEEPDNTIESFQKALDLGANAIETDICITKDNYLVLWHDWNPEDMIAHFRQLGKQGLKYRPYAPNLWERLRKPVPRLTLQELRKGYGYTLRGTGLGTKKKAPHKIPTMEEFCEWASKQERLEKIFFDIKIPKDQTKVVAGYFIRMIAVLDRYDLKKKVVCLIPNEEILKEASGIASENDLTICFDRELPPVLIIRPSKFSTVKKAIEYSLPFASIGKPVATLMGYSIYKKIISQDLKEARIHNFYKPAHPIEGIIAWSIDDPDEMRDLITLGVRGIITNKPEVLKKVVESWH